MTELQNYIKPELLALVAVLYVIGLMIKGTELIKNKFIPLILGIVGIVLCFIYVIGTEGLTVMSTFTAITQGVLVAGVAVYADQLVKQLSNDE